MRSVVYDPGTKRNVTSRTKACSVFEHFSDYLTFLALFPCAVAGERHREILAEIARGGQAASLLLTDAAPAAVAIEHGPTLHTTDRDFARFAGLKHLNPLKRA